MANFWPYTTAVSTCILHFFVGILLLSNWATVISPLVGFSFGENIFDSFGLLSLIPPLRTEEAFVQKL